MQSTPRLRLDVIDWRNFTICGASPEGEEAPPEDDTPSGSAADDAGSTDDDTKDPKARIKALQEERDRHYRERKAAEQKLNERLQADREAEQKDLSDAEKAKRELDDLKPSLNRLAEVNRRLALTNAFLIENTVQWHNPALALKLVDLSDVELEDDGSVKNPDVLKAAIKGLAKSDPYLIKAAATSEEPKTPPPASGTPPQGQATKNGQPDLAALQMKYPALRQH